MNNKLNIKAMENLKLAKSTAKKLFPDAPEWFKTVLVSTFGKDISKKRNFTDIKTYEDAIDEMPIDEENIIYQTDSVDIIAYKKLKHIIKVVNGPDFIVDWTNGNQKKWYPWFNILPSGFGFSDSSYRCTHSATAVGSRLCLESDEKATHMGTQFTNLYELFITIKN